MKVLVIEDDPSLREIICRSLEKERYVTEEAPDFQTALEKTADYTYDCILLDIMLPDGNGLDLLEELKKENKKENIIIISAKDSLEDKVTGLDLGADDYLPKPFHLAGFIASIYYRGIPFMQIPTTVVAQVDSSVGGKTAVNIPEGKNLVGAFHQPSVVVIDPTTLVTLDRRTLAEGLAEAVKHAAIKDASMLHELKGLGTELSIGFSLNTITRLPDLISRNVAIKARIVENDELETLDIRALLNFGHTIGHGIEAAVPYGTILHGEAVALGMRAALFLSERKAGLSSSDANKILRTLQALELPLVLPDGIDTATVLQKTASDKKFRAGTIRFVLLSKAGEAGISTKITREDMAEAIEELRRPLD